jgi:hypothetical protein
MCERSGYPIAQPINTLRQVLPEMNAQSTPMPLSQHLEISPRLGRLHDTEHIPLLRHWQVFRVVIGYLQENA